MECFGVPLFQYLQGEYKYVQEIMFVYGIDCSDVGYGRTKE